MKDKRISERQLKAWRFGAAAAPIAHLAAGCSWPVALTAGAAGILIGWIGSGKRAHAPWLCAIQWLVCVSAAGAGMHWMESFWQAGGSWGPLILLALAAWAAAKTVTVQAGVLLLWFVGFLLGSVLLSAIPEIRLENLTFGPEANEWERGLQLMGVILLTGMVESSSDESRKRSGGFPWLELAGYAVLCAVCTQGVLSRSIASEAASPFYELSRSVRFYGTFQRFESLAVMGMMLGMFLYLSYLCTIGREAGEQAGIKKRTVNIWATVLSVIFFYMVGTGEDRGFLAIGIVIAGYLIPWAVGKTKAGK